MIRNSIYIYIILVCVWGGGKDIHNLLTVIGYRESQVARILFLLFVATLLRTLGTIATYGAKVRKRKLCIAMRQ